MFISFASSKRSLLVLNVAPNLTLRQQTVLESSVEIHKINLVFGCALAIFINSTFKSHHLGSIIGSILNLRHLFARICIEKPF
jgi:hypothetical protein